MRWMKLLLVGLMAAAMANTVAMAKQKTGDASSPAKEVTVAGTISETKDQKGNITYSMSGDDGNTYALKGHATDLVTYKDKRAQVTGKEKDGKDSTKVIKVESVKEAPAKTT